MHSEKQPLHIQITPVNTTTTAAAVILQQQPQLIKKQKLKLDELFLYWLSLPQVENQIYALLNEPNITTNAAQDFSGLSDGLLNISMADSDIASKTRSPPPLSPNTSPISNQPNRDFVPPTRLFQKYNEEDTPSSHTVHQSSSPPSTPLSSLSLASSALSSPALSPITSTTNQSFTTTVTAANNKPTTKTATLQSAASETIPVFYTTKKTDTAAMDRFTQFFAANQNRTFTREQFLSVTVDLCDLPSYVNSAFFQKLDKDSEGRVTQAVLEQYWRRELMSQTDEERVFNVLKNPKSRCITAVELMPLMREVLDLHPGLQFLKSSPCFQDKYAETVIARIMYTVNRSGTGGITFREFKRSNLLPTLRLLDTEENINLMMEFFSYEHFYVLYCKFWELDTDHDFLIDRQDLMRYGNYSLTSRIVDRIWQGHAFPRCKDVAKPNRKMSYEEFIYFCLSEEDKTTEPAIEYWFQCMDVDGDGALTARDLQYFYSEQIERMEAIAQDQVIPYNHMIIQMMDMIKPDDVSRLTLRDMKRCAMQHVFWNAMFNLNKFIAFEARDPYYTQAGHIRDQSEWEKFARIEYDRMAAEDEDANQNNSSESYSDSIF